MKKFFKIGCLSLLGIFVLITVIAVIFSPSEKEIAEYQAKEQKKIQDSIRKVQQADSIYLSKLSKTERKKVLEKRKADAAEAARAARMARIKKNPSVINSEWDGSVKQVKRYLENNLKDPESYDPIEWSPVIIVDLPEWNFIVRHKYRARNSFGGMIIENQVFYLDEYGNIVKTMTN